MKGSEVQGKVAQRQQERKFVSGGGKWDILKTSSFSGVTYP